MSATTGFDLAALTELVNETEFGMNFYQEAIMANDTFAYASSTGQVLQGAKNDTYKLPLMTGTATAQNNDGCGHDSVDQTTFSQTELAMHRIKFEGQFCPSELEPYWLAMGLPAGQHYERSGLGSLEANIVAETARQIAKKMAIMPYHGGTGADTVTYNDSWLDLMYAATGINSGTTTPTNGGSAGTDAQGVFNIVETLKNNFLGDIDTAPEVFRDGGIVISMSPLHASMYFENYRTKYGDHTVVPVMEQLANGNMTSWIHPGSRIRIVLQNALGTNGSGGTGGTIIATRQKNQVLAFDLQSDATTLKMWYDQTDDVIYWRLRLKMGTAWRQLTATNVRYWGPAS